MFFREGLTPCERKPFSLPEKAVLSMGESRFVYERKPFCLSGITNTLKRPLKLSPKRDWSENPARLFRKKC